MAHHIYQTEAFVIESHASGEANKYFTLFTRELGMIEASAQGIRKVESKLRSSLRDFSRANIALVRGKNGWRLTNAIGAENLYDQFKGDKQILALVGNVFSLLKRLLSGEEKNEALFALVSGAFLFLKDHSSLKEGFLSDFSQQASRHDLTSEEISNAECILVLNILRLLGYLGESGDFGDSLSSLSPEFSWNKELLSQIAPLRQKALVEINRSLRESQL